MTRYMLVNTKQSALKDMAWILIPIIKLVDFIGDWTLTSHMNVLYTINICKHISSHLSLCQSCHHWLMVNPNQTYRILQYLEPLLLVFGVRQILERFAIDICNTFEIYNVYHYITVHNVSTFAIIFLDYHCFFNIPYRIDKAFVPLISDDKTDTMICVVKPV
jgi:hypothetical protein